MHSFVSGFFHIAFFGDSSMQLYISVLCSYFLDISPLSVISFPNIFSHSVCCLFVLSTVSYTVQKFLSLVRSCSFISAHFFCLKKTDPKKNIVTNLCQRVFYVLFQQFYVFNLFYFVYGMRKCSNFIPMGILVLFLILDECLSAFTILYNVI